MSAVKPWIKAMRPRTLPLSVSGVIVGSSMACYNGFFEIITFILAILATISFQILSNLANDYGDGVKGTDNEDRIGPARAIQSGEISPEQMLRGIKINITVTILIIAMLIYDAFGRGYYLYAFIFFVLALLCIYAAIRYTVGKKAYGYRAMGDLMVFLFFGLLSVMGSYFLFAKQLDHILILPACVIGLLSTGVLNLNNMRDIDSDTRSGKITLAVKFGWKRAKIYHQALITVALLLALIYGILYYRSWPTLLFLVAYIPLIIHILKVKRTTNPVELDSQLKVLALSTFALAILLGVGHILSGL